MCDSTHPTWAPSSSPRCQRARTESHPSFLAGRGVPARRIVVYAAVAHVHAINNGVPQRSTALDDSPAHPSNIVIGHWRCQQDREIEVWPIIISRMVPDSTHRAVTSLVAKSRDIRAVLTAKAAKAVRLSRIQIRRYQWRWNKVARSAYVAARMRLLRVQIASGRIVRSTFEHTSSWTATVVAGLVFLLFVWFVQDIERLQTSEVHLTCAQIIGAALALILSLSIIPAQRAAEAFSPAVLKLYAQDHWLVSAFLVLALTTTGSVLLGTNFLPRIDPRISVGIQFLLLGASLDALRLFHRRTLDLLMPITAIQLIVRECTGPLTRVSRLINKFIHLQDRAAEHGAPTDALRAIYFSASQVPDSLRFWISQLHEIAHKLIDRRDPGAANDIVTAMGRIGTQYSEARRNSLVLLPDLNNYFAGGVSDINEVLNPMYDSIRIICEDAANSSNELVVKHCINTMAAMTPHAMTMIHSSDGGWKQVPLAFSPCYWLGMCAKTAVKSNMGDATLAAVGGFQTILLNQKKDVSTAELEAQSLETLLTIAVASYGQADAVWGFPAVKAMLLAARHDIEMHGYRNISTLKTVLDYARSLSPLEVDMDSADKRVLQTFPPYNLGFEGSIPALLEMVSHQIQVKHERQWHNPFHDFLEAAEDVRYHYAKLSENDFGKTLLRKWVVDSLVAVARVHCALLIQPQAGTEAHLDDVDQSLRRLISWVPQYFPERGSPNEFHRIEAANSLTCLGISLLEHDRIETAESCASAVARLAANSAAVQPEPYVLADVHERLEILARAAAALGKAKA